MHEFKTFFVKHRAVSWNKIVLVKNVVNLIHTGVGKRHALGLFVNLVVAFERGAFLRRYIAEKPCALEKTEKLEQLRALWMGARIAVIRTEDEGVGVDTPEDAVRVESLLRLKVERNGPSHEEGAYN